jgi:hypothetical protein
LSSPFGVNNAPEEFSGEETADETGEEKTELHE